MLFNEENEVGPYWLRHLLRPEQQVRDVDVYAFPHTTGKSFKIVRIAIPGGYTFQEAHLTGTPSLTPDKDGIYYYGTLEVYGAVTVSNAEKTQLLKLAKEKYRKVFDALTPINFK